MKVSEFKSQFKIGYIFNDFVFNRKNHEIYDGDQSIFHDSFEDALECNVNGKTVRQHIEELTRMFSLDGGRGASGAGRNPFQGQNSGGGAPSVEDLPAKMNRMYNGNKMSQGNTVSTFRSEHATSKTEHAIMYDDDGFVSKYLHGGKSSVSFKPSDVAGKNMIHNHPSGSNFSAADLNSFSNTNMKSLTAAGANRDYTITKGAHFDSAGFNRAMQNTRTTETDYNKAVGNFLRQNQGRYGYTYREKDY